MAVGKSPNIADKCSYENNISTFTLRKKYLKKEKHFKHSNSLAKYIYHKNILNK